MSIKNIAYNGLYKFSGILFPLATVTYVSRILGPDGYGAVAAFLAVIGFLANLPSLPLGAYSVARLSKRENKAQDKLSSAFLVLSFLLAFIVAGIYLCFLIFSERYFSNSVYFIALLCVLSSCFSLEWFYQYKGLYGKLLFRTLAIRFLSLASIFVFVHSQEDFEQYAIIMVLMIALPNVYNLYLFSKTVRFYFSLNFMKKVLCVHSKNLAENASIGFFSSMYTLAPIAIAGVILSASDFSFVALSERIVRLFVSLTASVAIVLLPGQLKKYKVFNDEACQGIIKTIDLVSFISLSLGLGVMLFGEYIVLIIAGESFSSAAEYLSEMAILIWFMTISSVLIHQYYYAYNGVSKLLKIAIVVSAFSILATICLTSIMGSGGYVLAIIITESLLLTLLLVCSKVSFIYASVMKGAAFSLTVFLLYHSGVFSSNEYFSIFIYFIVFIVFLFVFELKSSLWRKQ